MDKYKPKTELFPIGIIAKSFGVSDNTIRRMEAAGLLTPAVIKESGYRYYDSNNIFRIKTILTLRNFGLVYDDMREFFNNAGDFTLVYDKLYEKKLAIDNLLGQARLHLKPDNPDEIFVIPHNEIFFFSEEYQLYSLTGWELIDDIAVKTVNDAIEGKYPVDYSRPLTIETDCLDFTSFDYQAPHTLRLLIPLRYKVDGPDTYSFPQRKVLSVAYYNGVSFQDIVSSLETYMRENCFKQCGFLAGTMEIAKHMDSSISDDQLLFHIMIPVEEI